MQSYIQSRGSPGGLDPPILRHAPSPSPQPFSKHFGYRPPSPEIYSPGYLPATYNTVLQSIVKPTPPSGLIWICVSPRGPCGKLLAKYWLIVWFPVAQVYPRILGRVFGSAAAWGGWTDQLTLRRVRSFNYACKQRFSLVYSILLMTLSFREIVQNTTVWFPLHQIKGGKKLTFL